MDCRTAREALLEAEPGSLPGAAAGPLADHLRGCPECTAAAARIVHVTATLAEDLTPRGRIEPRTPATALVIRRRAWRVAALAAAAVITLLLTRAAPDPVAPAATDVAAPTPIVTVPEGRNAMVFRTADPQITVVWYY